MLKTLTMVLGQAVTPRDRLSAVHRYFDSREGSHTLGVVFGALILAVLLCGLLLLVHRVQIRKQQRAAEARAKRRQSMTRAAQPSLPTLHASNVLVP